MLCCIDTLSLAPISDLAMVSNSRSISLPPSSIFFPLVFLFQPKRDNSVDDWLKRKRRRWREAPMQDMQCSSLALSLSLSHTHAHTRALFFGRVVTFKRESR